MTTIHRGFRFRVYPTLEQETQFRQFAGVVRLVYNLALEQRRDFWRQHKRTTGSGITAFGQGRELTTLRAEFDWIRAVPQVCQQYALRDLDKAYAAFFAGRAGYPRPRRKGEDDTFRFLAREVPTRILNAEWSEVRLPKIGWVKYRDTRPLRGKVCNATVALATDGWHIAFTCEIEHQAPVPLTGAVGIDRGVTNTLTLSTGEMMRLPASLARIEAQKRRAQHVLSRRKKGSNRRDRQRRRVARLQARQARIRRDFHHRASLDIARRFGTVVLEDLKTANMTRSAKGTIEAPGRNVAAKAGLNRAILASGWHQFATLLAYKVEERGGTVVMVPARHTSQTCAACGTVDVGSRESQARFRCVTCGHTDHADVNAAVEILRRGSPSSLHVEARALARPAKREPAGRMPREPQAAEAWGEADSGCRNDVLGDGRAADVE